LPTGNEIGEGDDMAAEAAPGGEPDGDEGGRRSFDRGAGQAEGGERPWQARRRRGVVAVAGRS
jgi:hypothetical protein